MAESTSSRTVLVFGAATESMSLLQDAKPVALPIETLRANLRDFIANLDAMLPPAGASARGMPLKSIEVALAIDGKGQVGFLGTGAELGGSATLTLTFERRSDEARPVETAEK